MTETSATPRPPGRPARRDQARDPRRCLGAGEGARAGRLGAAGRRRGGGHAGAVAACVFTSKNALYDAMFADGYAALLAQSGGRAGRERA